MSESDATHSVPTSPRLRGEHRRPLAAVLSAKNADARASAIAPLGAAGEGDSPTPSKLRAPLTPTLSPQAGRGSRAVVWRVLCLSLIVAFIALASASSVAVWWISS